MSMAATLAAARVRHFSIPDLLVTYFAPSSVVEWSSCPLILRRRRSLPFQDAYDAIVLARMTLAVLLPLLLLLRRTRDRTDPMAASRCLLLR